MSNNFYDSAWKIVFYIILFKNVLFTFCVCLTLNQKNNFAFAE